VIEHKVRHDSGLFFNFNGTAGIWRREAVEQAGGWQHDTLTEDLDLSYRSQLRGWKFVYAPYVVAPAEVPPGIGAFKSQQHRWAKGSVQVLRKLMGSIMSSREPWRVKAEAWAHLTGNVGYPSVLLLSILLPLASGLQRQGFHWWHLAAFLACTLSVGLFYETSQRAIDRPLRRRLADTVLAMTLGIGMCVGQTRAVFSGMFGSTGTFVRTPKRGDGTAVRQYRTPLTDLPGIELLFAAWFGWGLIAASRLGNWGSLPFLALFFGGFAWVGTLSLREQFGRSQQG
jgi:cellulose synthase/poly-beta-1,6-N-acetylglucosamine synthase-like glycosyltransferase